MPKLQKATLVFLVKTKKEKVTDICLAMKKRGFGVGKWNGVGGKVKPKEKIRKAAKRETIEEIGINPKNLKKVAKLSFYFSNNPKWDQVVYVYFCQNWQGEPIETEEMKPAWYKTNELPFEIMWPDDKFWLPKAIKGNYLKGKFEFGENDSILEKKIKLVNKI